ncbi:MAG: hypothetical protein ACOCQD_05185 [archaeon]
MQARQRGQKTYIRFLIRSVFEKDFIKKEFNRISKEIEDALDNVTATHEIFETWTKFGPSGKITVSDQQLDRILLQIGIYRDGWHIKIKSINYREFFPEISEKIFGDKNRKEAWTQQTSLVIPMTIKLIKELRYI